MSECWVRVEWRLGREVLGVGLRSAKKPLNEFIGYTAFLGALTE